MLRAFHSAPSFPTRYANQSRRTIITYSTVSSQDAGAVARLKLAGIEIAPSVSKRNPQLVDTPVAKVEPMLDFLAGQGMKPADVELMLLRCPKLFSFNVTTRCTPAVDWLASLGLSQQQVADTIKRFPHILGYDTKAHLIPHCHYLKSLGLSDDELTQLILLRPHVMGVGIELVITYLRKWLRIQRTHVGKLLWSYPLDYSLPRLVLPSQIAVIESVEEDGSSPAADTSSHPSSSGDTTAAAGPTASASASSEQQEQEEEQQRRQQAPLGSPERCTWLDLKPGKGSSDEGGSSSSGGGTNGNDGQSPRL